jgi:hypothetical protein
LVARYLETGADANGTVLANDEITDDEDGERSVASHVKFSEFKKDAHISLLFFAVRNCFDHPCEANAYSKGPTHLSADKVMKALLDNGADATATASFLACNIGGYRWYAMKSTTPLQFAVFLKQHKNGYSSYFEESMDRVIAMLSEAGSVKYRLQPKMIHVPVSTKGTWASLLFSEDFSDVKFSTSSGDTVHAHRCILAAASEYFAALFRGPWRENSSECINTAHETQILKAVLRFVYVGEMDVSLLEQQTAELLSVATEYNLPDLQQLCEQRCMDQLSVGNVKDMLLLAHLHSSNALKQGCFGFVRQHAAKVLMMPSMITLAQENAALWAEMGEAVNGGGQQVDPHKRKRNVRQRVR